MHLWFAGSRFDIVRAWNRTRIRRPQSTSRLKFVLDDRCLRICRTRPWFLHVHAKLWLAPCCARVFAQASHRTPISLKLPSSDGLGPVASERSGQDTCHTLDKSDASGSSVNLQFWTSAGRLLC